MNFSRMLRRFGPAATLIAIRSSVVEPYRARPSGPQHDPWFGGDPLYRTAWAGVVPVVPA